MTTRRTLLLRGPRLALILAIITALVSVAALPPAAASPPAAQPDAHPATSASSPAPGLAPSGPTGRPGRAAPAAGSRLLTCGASGSQMLSIGAGDYQTLRTCDLTVPEAGQIFVSANGSVGYDDAYAQALFRIEIGDDPKMETDRYVAVHSDTGDGSDASVALSGLFDVQAGSHTFSFLGIRNSGTGTINVFDPTLTLLYIPGTGTGLLACGHMGAGLFTTTSDSFVAMRTCSLSIPDDGWVFISADGSAWGAGAPFEAAFDFDIDGTDGSGNTPRYVDAYKVGALAVDRTVALTMLKPVTAGDHTFNFLVKRWTGTSDVSVANPALTVIYIPAASPDVASCAVLDSTAWTTDADKFAVIRECSLTIPEDSWAFITADASAAVAGEAIEAHLALDIDDTSGDDDVDRYANVYTDSYDGTDHTVAVSVLKPLAAGRHTFYFLGTSTSGGATTLLRHPTLTVLVPLSRLAAPVLTAPADGAGLCAGQPTFTWDGVEGATSHQIQIYGQPIAGPPQIDETVMGASYTVAPSQALGDGLYAWRVRGLRPSSTGDWSAEWQFSVGPPQGQVTLLSPADQSALGATPTFTWDALPAATGYDIQVDNQAGFPSPEVDDSTSDAAFTPAQALAADTYFWRARATNSCGPGPWSATWQLTIAQAAHMTYLPLIIRGR